MAKDHIEIINLKKRLASTIPTIPVNFTDLADTFAYAGNALKTVRVNATATGLEAYTISIDQTRIQDGTNTTYLDVDEVANVIKGKSANTGTNDIFQLFEGTATPVKCFHVDGNGDLLRNGKFFVKKIGAGSIYLGTNETHSGRVAPEGNNTVIGGSAAKSITGGYNNTIIGFQSAFNISSGVQNVIIGNAAGYQILTGKYNVYIGTYSGYNNSNKDKNIFIGMYSGYRQTTAADKLLIANQDYTTAAAELTNSIINGTMAAAPANQDLRINAKLCVNVAPLTNMVAGDAVLQGGSLILKEITTPTADVNYGKVYTKSDNKLYFQDGGGTEHEIAYV